MTDDRKSECLTCRDFIRKLQTDKNVDFCFCTDSGEKYAVKNTFVGNSLSEPTNHPKFWKTGGSCGFSGHNSYIGHDEWIIDPEMLPEEIRCYADKIAEIFNKNVEHGCCGGCL